MNDESDSFIFHFLAICMDNASICDVLARATGILLLKKYGVNFHEENAQIQCIAHIVNLIIQALLTSLNKAEDPDIDDYYIPNKHLPFHYDPDDDDEVQQMEAEDEEFTELLHMKLENEELEGELIAKVIYISEVKKMSYICLVLVKQLTHECYLVTCSHQEDMLITPMLQTLPSNH